MATTAFPDGVRHAHPIHAILSAYPLAFFTGTLATDVIYARSADIMWANFSVWMIAAGLLMGVLAAIAGIVDALTSRRRARPGDRRGRRSLPHTILTTLMMALALVNAFVHSRDGWTSVVPTGLILSAIVSVLAVVSSWLGYTLDARQEAA